MISEAIPRLRIRNFVPRGGWYHVARHVRVFGHATPAHRHDFPEVFWIERGSLVHTVNTVKQELRAGEGVLIRPDDAHGIRCLQGGFSLVNVAFPATLLRQFRARHYAGLAKAWPWQGGHLPAQIQIQPDDMPRLAWLADELARGPQSRLRLEAFLAGLLLCLERGGGGAATESLPDWLRGALLDCARPEHLAGGVPRLAKLAGRTQEHINRVVRKHLGRTTTDLLNEMRLAYASRELTMSARPILEIAMDAGFENLSYFYRLFTRRFSMTPRQFRLKKQMLMR